MKRELVVVVHGVGVRKAGVSTDLVALALDQDPENGPEVRTRRARGEADQPSGNGWVPHASGDFHLREPDRYTRGRLRATFAAWLRRYRKYHQGQITHERVFADFYWGDISGTGGDVWRVLVGFVKVVLGLSHAIRENAASVWPDRPGLRRLANCAALTVHGPVFALNLVMLGGALLNAMLLMLAPTLAPVLEVVAGWAGPGFGMRMLGLGGWLAAVGGLAFAAKAVLSRSVWLAGLFGIVALAGGLGALVAAGPIWAIVIVAVAAGWSLGAMSHAFLLRLLADWLMITGLVVPLALVVPDGVGPALLPFTDAQSHVVQASVIGLGKALVTLAMAGWAVPVVFGLVLLVCKRLRAHRDTPPADFLAAALALMLVVSLVLVGAVWGSLLQLPLPGLPDQLVVGSALVLTLPATLVLMLAIVLSGLVFLRARAGAAQAQEAYKNGNSDATAEANRLIVSGAVIALLEGVLIVIGLSSAGAALAYALMETKRLDAYVANANDMAVIALPLLAGAAALAVGALRAPLAMGIGIAIDVLVYLNSYSWTTYDTRPTSSDVRPPAPTRSRTWLEHVGLRWLGRARLVAILPAGLANGGIKSAEQDQMPRDYWLRMRIQDRLTTLMGALLDHEKPDSIVVIAHSQGTVIALDMIEAEGKLWSDDGDRPIRLVTMGSPYTHIYNRYFPASFPSHRERAALLPRTHGGVLTGWVNIFRADDFVGTHIDAGYNRRLGGPPTNWPQEVPLGPGGHTMYWVDNDVFDPLRKAVAEGHHKADPRPVAQAADHAATPDTPVSATTTPRA